MNPIVIVGAGGFGREVCAYAADLGWPVAGFADDEPRALDGFTLPVGVLGPVDAVDITPATRFIVAVGDPALRHKLAAAVIGRGGVLGTLVHPRAYVAAGARLEPGCVVCPFAFVGSGAHLAANAVVNIHASVGHDATVGEHAVLSPFAAVNGHASIGAAAFLGTHATVTPGRRVGTGAKVSAGSVVLRDVPAGALAVGNPARSRVMFPDAG
ncbi:acetyltransferase [Virgisporangium aliadipatigenens]|uniref:Acetyltransferase n=1 Tax=Virgisporangium aliadipatigenens TaxID=741659 RepID=A0A8J4DVZ8_9ACTN|nr:acetyltransferase [Virgisporangium aliadipatigenens]GIJ51688.1 acetyltransferase [Virgisporangium aliadipatigenens]